VKNDDKDEALLADLLGTGSLPEAWISPPELRELRGLVGHRSELSQLRTGLKSQVLAEVGQEGVIPRLTELWGPAGTRWLDGVGLADVYRDRIVSLQRLIGDHDRDIRRLDRTINGWLRDDVGYNEIQRINGVGPLFAAIFVAEIGDVSGFE
jgi:transposase